ncbi:Dyp-type peroxidase, partial [Nocardiopsis sp. MG754419]|uniref:Dyp-type peroxidase n=1 Tax=Nocardiopsis sp. MG754419 TaxID=2259865 RepID=UPI001BAC0247
DAVGRVGADHGEGTVPFHGHRQAGIETPPQAHTRLLGLDLDPETDAEGVRRLLVLLSDDVARLSGGEGALADTEPELASSPARLTVTFGFGRGLVERVAPGAVPEWLTDLPDFTQDTLRPEWGQTDLLLQVCSDDPVTVAHTARILLRDARAHTRVRWVQDGFRRARGTEPAGTTMRNLMGQVDGTVNPAPGTEDFDHLVWHEGDPAWLSGGTSLVLRRIATDLDTWDELDRPAREAVMGRRVSDGAPLTGEREHDEPDFAATGPGGLTVIADFAHIRRARTDDPEERMFRRAYNYEDPASGESGLLFVSFQSDPVRRFVPVQRRLDELDLLNSWVTAVGSAVYAIPPGCEEGGFVGHGLWRD